VLRGTYEAAKTAPIAAPLATRLTRSVRFCSSRACSSGSSADAAIGVSPVCATAQFMALVAIAARLISRLAALRSDLELRQVLGRVRGAAEPGRAHESRYEHQPQRAT
jgi:hypothetical protein